MSTFYSTYSAVKPLLWPAQCLELCRINCTLWLAVVTTTVLWPSCRTAGVSHHPQLRGARFRWSKVLWLAWPCWWQIAHPDYEKDDRDVTCAVIWLAVLTVQKASRLLLATCFSMQCTRDYFIITCVFIHMHKGCGNHSLRSQLVR